MCEITVGGVETFSTVDFPEHLAAVVFLQGCPWRCPFCYNTDLQLIGKKTDFIWKKFVEFLRKRRGVLDAVVFSGGEPLVHNGLATAMAEVKAIGYKVGLHTGGYRPEQFGKALPLVDWIGFDIKAPLDEERYQQVTGPSHLGNVLKSFEMLLASAKDFECRTTCDPRLLTSADLRRIGESLRAKGVKKYFLQKYRPVPSDKETTEEQCEALVSDEKLLEFLQNSFEEFSVRK